MTAVVTAGGLLELPSEVCEKLGLTVGQKLEVHAEGGLFMAWKQTASNPLEKWRGRGKLPVGQTTDEHLRLTLDGDSRIS
jgi:bifunctional DNA-binding transcriptional regulator/antitoxin component of YhaV-PrlF toxin-antitoxin module